MEKVTLHDVAVRAGVSDSTVSRALRGLDKVDERTRTHIQRIAATMHFAFSRNASSLASGRTMRVSLLFSNALNTWFDSSVLQGAYEVLFPNSYDIVPSMVRDHAQLDAFFQRLPTDGNVDALIVSSINLDSGQSAILRDLTIPTVGIDSRTIDGFDASVLVDDQQAMHDVVSLLRHLGHRQIAFVGWPEPGDFQFSTQLRVEAFKNAAQDLGYGTDEVQRFDVGKLSDYRNMDDALASAAARILSAERRPTAICVETDEFAVALMAKLASFGIRIPQDLSVIGFDDSDVAAAVNLTTVHQDPVEMSRVAATKALALMRGEALTDPHSIIRPILMLRGTTGGMVGANGKART